MTVSFNNSNTPQKQVSTKKQPNQASFGRNPKVLSEKATNLVENFGVSFDSAMQRGLTGVFALTQPVIDINNKSVDEKTRKVSAARTTAKILVGTTTGVLIREICVQLTKLFSQNDNIRKYENEHNLFKGKKQVPFEPKQYKNWQQWLLLKANEVKDGKKLGAEQVKELANKMSSDQIKRMRNAVGTIAAIGIMVFTNIFLDNPLTTCLQNKIVKKFDNEGGNKCQ